MKNKYTSEDGRVELFSPDLIRNHKIYVEEDMVGNVSLNGSPTISFDGSFVFHLETLQEISQVIYEAREDINVKDRQHLQTLKDYQSWRLGSDDVNMPVPKVLSDAMQWAIEKLENDDI